MRRIIRRVDPWLHFGQRPLGIRVNTVVLHASAGSTLEGAISTLRNRGLSYHFLIDKDGTVWRGCPVLGQADHAGESEGPQGKYANRYSIGVCFVNENDGRNPVAPAQLDAARWLLPELKGQMYEYKWLCTHWAITVDARGRARKTDPRLVDVPALAAAVGLTPWKPAHQERYSI